MRTLPALLILLALLSSCHLVSPYGKRIEINSKSEIYYQEPGVKEADVRTLGEFLLRNQYFDNSQARSVQVLKPADTFVVRFVVDSVKVAENSQYEIAFMAMKLLLRDSVFHGQPTRVELANSKLEPFRKFD